LGHILFGGNPEKLAIFLVGSRNTGKTTMINAIQAALGDYAATFQPNAVFKDSGTGNNPELGNLLHKRGIFSSESGSQRIHANPLKRNTGGDKVSVTRKYANDQIIGIPHFVSVVATNQSPTVEDADEALIKRIMVLPFATQVDDTNNDRRADVTVPREAKRAVLCWLAIGFRNYIREGLNYKDWHDKAKAATLEFTAELSEVSTFLNEICTVAPDELRLSLNKMPGSLSAADGYDKYSKISCSVLYRLYLEDALVSNQKPISSRAFNKKVKEVFGIETVQKWQNGRNEKVYLGLKWRNEEAMRGVTL
jgi:P4 family phage/plasmid primase-like protien